MNITSRHTGATQGSNHAAPAAGSSGTGGNAANAGSSKAAGHGKSGRLGGAFANLLTGRISIPRHLVVHARSAVDNSTVPIQLRFTGTIGQGTFGQIEKATLTTPPPGKTEDGKTAPSPPPSTDQSRVNTSFSDTKILSVAVKRVLQDPRYKNRELSIMQKLNRHPNVVKFYFYYFSTSSASNSRNRRSQPACEGVCSDIPPNTDMDVYLHLVLECFPGSLCEMVYMYFQRTMSIPSLTVKILTYQMLKALAYLHSHRICHRDIKSSNLLVNEPAMVLKLCDFGSAKEMVPGSANVSYISSRYVHLYTCFDAST